MKAQIVGTAMDGKYVNVLGHTLALPASDEHGELIEVVFELRERSDGELLYVEQNHLRAWESWLA